MEVTNHSAKETLLWFSPDAFIVDGIVAVLKRTGRWRRDGKSLRLLNKHWCLEINAHIISIHPQGTLAVVDAQSLLKFRNITALNITPFCCRPRCKARSETCSQVMAILHQLPMLTDLEMDDRVLSTAKKDEIDGLKCRTVKLEGWRTDVEDLFKLCDLPLVELRLNRFRGSIDHFLEASPLLKRMSVSLDHFDTNDFRGMASLEELGVHVWSLTLDVLSSLTSIVSLRIMEPQVDSLEPFKELRKLQKLELIIRSSDVFDDVFWCVMGRLTRLALQSKRRYVLLPTRFWELAAGLEELEFRHLRIESGVFLQHDFSKLRRLSLSTCVMDGETLPCDELISLTSLHLIDIMGRGGELIEKSFDPRPIKGLKELCIFFRNPVVNLNEELLHRISQLGSLETLKFSNVMGMSNWKALPYNGFESLGKLPNLANLQIGLIYSKEVAERLSNMKFLAGLEHVDLKIDKRRVFVE